MTTAVGFAKGAGLVSREELAASLNNAAMSMPRAGGDYQYLKMDKGNGDWIYGQDETVVEDGSLWAVNPASFQHGYISWDRQQQVEGEVMVPIGRPRPNPDNLRVDGSADGRPTGQNGWQFQMSVDMVCVPGADEGTVIQYKQSSVGAMKAFRALTDAVATQLQRGDAIVPIVEMKSDSYKHKKYGRIFNPIFEIKEWRTLDDTSAPAAGTDAPRAAEPAPEPDTDEDAALAAEYAAEQEKPADSPAPRRRVRR